MEVSGPSFLNQTNWLQVGLQEHVQIIWLTLKEQRNPRGKGISHKEVIDYEETFPP